MAKKRKNKAEKAKTKISKPTPKAIPVELIPENPELLQKVFRITAGLMLVILLAAAWDVGINGDDKFQNDYSGKLVDFYTSFGSDQAALNVPQGNMHYYGGFFDLSTGLVNKALGLDIYDAGYHRVRHLFNALLGWLAILFTALCARLIAGPRAGILALVLLFLSPRFFGHTLMNPKDIPFAAGYIIAVYFLLKLLARMPKPSRRDCLGFVLGTALAIATRAGGMLLFAYLGLFFFLNFIENRKSEQGGTLSDYLKYGIGLTVAAYALALVFWPFGLVSPLVNPMEALGEFSKLGIRIRVLFAGESIMSDSEPWYYALSWMYRTIPILVSLGFLASFFFIQRFIRKGQTLLVSLLWFSAIFPIVFITAKESLLHDAWRHLIFVYPSIVAVAALAFSCIESKVVKNNVMRYGLYGLLTLGLLETGIFILRNPSLSYTYFQPLAGGVSAHYGYYETDYWGLSVREAVDWMEEEGIIGENMQDTVTIASSFAYPLEVYLKKYNKVKTKYTRFQGRYSSEWDYAIFPTRFINAGQVRKSFPPKKAVHTVRVGNTPMAAIIHDEHKYTFRAERAVRALDTLYAVEQFQKELKDFPDNEQAWLGLSDAYRQMKKTEDVLKASTQALNIAPDNVSAMYFQGWALAQLGRQDEAKRLFEQAVATDSEFYIAYFYLGVIAMESGDLESALKYAQTTLEIKPSFRNAQLLVAEIYTLAGQKEKGDAFLKKMERFRK